MKVGCVEPIGRRPMDLAGSVLRGCIHQEPTAVARTLDKRARWDEEKGGVAVGGDDDRNLGHKNQTRSSTLLALQQAGYVSVDASSSLSAVRRPVRIGRASGGVVLSVDG
jgi:hypothetical protein